MSLIAKVRAWFRREPKRQTTTERLAKAREELAVWRGAGFLGIALEREVDDIYEQHLIEQLAGLKEEQ